LQSKIVTIEERDRGVGKVRIKTAHIIISYRFSMYSITRKHYEITIRAVST